MDLANAVVEACDQPHEFKFLYPLDIPLKDKIHAIATKIYGADDVDYAPLANQQLASYEEHGYGNLPICMAKTHLSISHEARRKGRPSDYTFQINDVRASIGAGFIYPIAGNVVTMPGLPGKPRALDVDAEGRIIGL